MTSALKRAGRAIDAVNHAAFVAGAALIASIAAIYCYEVGARYFFNAPTEWANLLAGVLFSVGTFLVVPEVTRRGAHVAVDVVIDGLGGRAQRRMRAVLAIVAAAICAVACVATAIEAHRQMVDSINIMSTIIIPKWIVTVFMPFGFFGATYYFAVAASRPAAAKDLP